MRPKYSLIIPTYNGYSYLPMCVKTIIDQRYENYELIISDDHSTDGTKEYLSSLECEKIKIIEPPCSMSMSEHWEWALKQAVGEWIMFVGQDDGVQSYFFCLAEKLTAEASKRNIKAIMSERAYFFWPGCQNIYGDKAVEYQAKNKIYTRRSSLELWKSLLGIQEYFNLPEMYTTSLVHKDVIEKARKKQEGKVIITHPQDANLAVILCSLEKKYIYSGIPFGWVGSSPKSAGMAIVSPEERNEQKTDLGKLKKEYESRIAESRFPYHKLAGDFSIGNLSIYLWQVMLQTEILHKNHVNWIIRTKMFRRILFAIALFEIKTSVTAVNENRLKLLKDAIKINGLQFTTIMLFSVMIMIINRMQAVVFLFYKVPRKLIRAIFDKRYGIKLTWSQNQAITMYMISNNIRQEIVRKGWVQREC